MILNIICFYWNRYQTSIAIANRSILGKLNLPKDNDGSNNQDQGNSKLDDNQHLSWYGGVWTNLKIAFEYANSPERGQIKGRITSRKETRYQAEAKTGQPKKWIPP
jgi:hypothetical protein